MCLGVILTMILKMVAGTRQKNPGSQNSTVKMIVTTILVTKAYLGSIVSVGVVSVCCVATTGISGWVITTCGCRGVRGGVVRV